MRDKLEPQEIIGVRLPESIVKRVDKLTAQIRAAQPGSRATRSEVIRLATARGVEILEIEQQSGKKRKG